jgi:hypothetical protein
MVNIQVVYIFEWFDETLALYNRMSSQPLISNFLRE